MASRRRGEFIYKIYRIITYGLTPLVRLHIRWRKYRGLEHPDRWLERLGRPSLPRPAGPIVWFHAVSLGEGMAALPVIKCSVERRPDVTVLLTTTTASAFEVIKNRLPTGVIYQFAPLDIPTAMDAFLDYWKPNTIILVESELWPNLIMSAAKSGISLALLNARMSIKSFRNWSLAAIFPLTTLMLSKFSLILPLSTTQGIQFQLLEAPPFNIHYPGDLKCAIEDFETSERYKTSLNDLQLDLSHRKVWMASSIHKGEEEVIIGAHHMVKEMYPDLVTIIVPRHPQHAKEFALKLQKNGVSVALRSSCDSITLNTNIYMVDTLGELRDLYGLSPVAVIGGSFFHGSAGHNILESASAGCAILTGHHIGHFSHMALEMQRINPLSVLQVSAEKLGEAIAMLLGNDNILKARRLAAKQAHHSLSSGVVENVWRLVHFYIYCKSVAEVKVERQST